MQSQSFSQQNYNCCLLTIGINAVAVFRNSQHSFKIFDSHSRYLHGNLCLIHLGHVLCSALKGLKTFFHICSSLALIQTCTVAFEIKGVLISDTQPDVEHVHESYQQKFLSLSNQTNPEEPISLKRKYLTEKWEVNKQLIGQRELY